MKTFELADGGLLMYDEAFLAADLADCYFAELRDHCAWEQKPGVFGHMQPRFIASYGEPGIVPGRRAGARAWRPGPTTT